MEAQSHANPPDQAPGPDHLLPAAFEFLRRRPLLLASGVFLAIMMVFFFDAVLGDKTYLSGDVQAAAAIAAPLQEALWEDGNYPLWTPYIFCGMPSFASLSFTPFAYFPHFVEQMLARVLPVNMWFIFACHYVFAGLGVFVFLRRKGTGVMAGLLGGFAFMLTPYLITMTVYGHGSQMMTAAYIPWVFWAADRLLEKASLRNIGLAGLMMGLMLQRAHVQIAYYGLMLAGLYFVWHMATGLRRMKLRRLLSLLGGVAGALILAFALAAMLYLPLREYTSHSIRGASSVLEAGAASSGGVGFDYATQWSFSPGEMMTFLFPSFYGFGGSTYWGAMPFTDYPNYMGILVLILAMAAFAFYPSYSREQRILVSFLGFIALWSLLISFGRHFPSFYQLLYDHLPNFNKFRVPVMILILLQYGVAVLAGLGLESILARMRAASPAEPGNTNASRWAWNLLIVSAVVGGMLLLAAVIHDGLFEFMRGVYPDKLEAKAQLRLDADRFGMLYFDIYIAGGLIIAALVALALALFKKIRPAHAGLVLCLLVLADLWRVDAQLGRKNPKQQAASVFQPDAIVQFLQTDSSLFRIYPAGELYGEMRWSAQGFQSVGGYHAAKMRAFQDFATAMDLQRAPVPELANHHIVDMINAKYVLTLATLPDTAWIPRLRLPVAAGAQERHLTIYENPTVLPRAYLAGRFEVESEPFAALRRMRAGANATDSAAGFDPHRSVMLDEIPACAPAPDSSATLEILQYGLHHIAIQTRSASAQMLVLSDSYYPEGWQAYVDDKPVKTYRANYCFRAVCLPAGEHRVEFRYQSGAFQAGVWTSVTALALGLAFLFIDRPRGNGG